jgi:hypothetical protein
MSKDNILIYEKLSLIFLSLCMLAKSYEDLTKMAAVDGMSESISEFPSWLKNPLCGSLVHIVKSSSLLP